jgi:diguanylate cyclase (GGDEF)-like protein/putative nucleotidyltransferase with HDIG domain
MDPPLRRRLSWRATERDGVVTPLSHAAMARTGAYFAVVAAAFGLLAIVIPHGSDLDEGLLAAVSGATALLGVALIVEYDRIPLLGFHAAAAGGTALASLAVYAWGTPSFYGPLPYLWVTFFVFCFFSLRAALGHMAWIGLAFAVELLAANPSYVPAAAWVATVGTLLAIGLLVGFLRDHLMGLIGSLTDAARRDPLTELLNRRGFEEAFDIELERARRAGGSLSLLVSDLDRFKHINDKHGHAAGDEALRNVARLMRSTKRSFDSAARVGGEEFALLAPDADEHGAYILAERIRAEIERLFTTGAGELTMSFGIATFPLHGQSAEALMGAADQALYAAKRLGRNRSVISSAEVPGILARPSGGSEDAGHIELATLLNLAQALDVRDFGNPAHCQRVGRFAELMARELGLPPDSVERIRLAGILHDVGRVGVPEELLEKRGPLSDEEWRLVRAHPETGARMLATTDFDDIRLWILEHHERPDGAGYPNGLPWSEVPLEARILGVADAYEAMTSERPWRAALPSDKAAEELRRGAGRQFDADVVEALLRVV